MAPVEVLIGPFITSHATIGLTIELRAAMPGAELMDAMRDAMCQVHLADTDQLQFETLLALADDSPDAGPFKDIVESLLGDIRKWVMELAPSVSLSAGPNLSQDINIATRMLGVGIGPGRDDILRHILSATVTKSSITTAIRNLPAAFAKGHNVNVAATFAGAGFQIMEFEGTGTGLAGWHKPGMVGEGKVQAKVDVYVAVGAQVQHSRC